jgi:hypothetical protein
LLAAGCPYLVAILPVKKARQTQRAFVRRRFEPAHRKVDRFGDVAGVPGAGRLADAAGPANVGWINDAHHFGDRSIADFDRFFSIHKLQGIGRAYPDAMAAAVAVLFANLYFAPVAEEHLPYLEIDELQTVAQADPLRARVILFFDEHSFLLLGYDPVAVIVEPVYVLGLAVNETVRLAEWVAHANSHFQDPGVTDIEQLSPLREILKGGDHTEPAGAQSHTMGGNDHVLSANPEVKIRIADAAFVFKEQDHRWGIK